MTMRFLLPLLLALSIIGCASPKQAKTSTANKRMTVRTTAYTHTEAGGVKNAIGGRLSFGSNGTYSAASDWSWLPLGTRFKLLSTGNEYVIEDYGSALVGRQTIDLYFPNMRSVRGWGVRNEEIEILEWGSQAMSLKLLAPRARNSHVATMVAALRRQAPVPST